MAKAKRLSNRKGTATEAYQNKKNWGNEPDIPQGEISDLELAKALTWYNYVEARADARDYLLEYLKTNKDTRYAAVRRAGEKSVRPTAGWIARLMLRGAVISEDTMASFNRLVDDSARDRFGFEEPDEDAPKVIEPPKPSVHQRTIDKAGDLIADLEDVLDKWEENAGYSTYEYMNKNSVPPKIAQVVVKYYEPLLKELQSKDADIKEAYAYLPKRKFNGYLLFVTHMIDEINKYVGTTKKAVVRKPRKTKAQTPEQKFKFLRYMKESTTHKIKSVNPSSIIGASELWMFDTKTNRMTVFRASSERGLDIKRSAVVGYVDNKSVSKVVGRKAQTVIDGVVKGTKTQLKKMFEAVNTTGTPPKTDRTNENAIFVRVFK